MYWLYWGFDFWGLFRRTGELWMWGAWGWEGLGVGGIGVYYIPLMNSYWKSLAFGQILFRGYLRSPKNLGSPLFLCFIVFLWASFFNLYPLCVSMLLYQLEVKGVFCALDVWESTFSGACSTEVRRHLSDVCKSRRQRFKEIACVEVSRR